MSFRSLCNRTVSIVPMTVDGKDRANNDVRTPGPAIEGVRARRDEVAATEELLGRSEQAKTFRYFLELIAADGTPVVISGRDRIVDGDETFEVDGTPELIDRRRRPHHFEATAVRVEG